MDTINAGFSRWPASPACFRNAVGRVTRPRADGNKALRELVEERSRAYFGNDAMISTVWEPDGTDFFSPSLLEAAPGCGCCRRPSSAPGSRASCWTSPEASRRDCWRRRK